MTEQNNNDAILDRVEATLKDFRVGAEKVSDLSVRIGKRTTGFLRALALSLLIMGVILTYLITTLKGNIGGFLDEMQVMADNMDKMTVAVSNMDKTMSSMSKDEMQVMAYNMGKMTVAVSNMDKTMSSMSNRLDSMPEMAQDTLIMADQITGMRQEIENINYTLGGMSNDMDKISKPMRMFPFP